jgi:hypothetical protein
MNKVTKFHISYIAADSSAYYHPRWDQAITAEIISDTKEHAFDELGKILGKVNAPQANYWAMKITKIEQILQSVDTRDES